jgi:hypothetical protein
MALFPSLQVETPTVKVQAGTVPCGDSDRPMIGGQSGDPHVIEGTEERRKVTRQSTWGG